MTYRDALIRAGVTFVAGATAAPISAAVFNVSFLAACGIAGVIAVWNLVARSAQAWLAAHPEDRGGVDLTLVIVAVVFFLLGALCVKNDLIF